MDQAVAADPVETPNILVSPLSPPPTATQVIDLPPDQIFIAAGRKKRGLKLDKEEDQLFIKSVQQIGIRQPVEVRRVQDGPRPYELVYGQRRLATAKHIGLATIPAKVAAVNDKQMEFIAIAEQTMRRPMDYPEYIKQLKIFMRRMEELFGPDPGKSIGGKERASNARRDPNNGQMAADPTAKPPENKGENNDNPATVVTTVAGEEKPKTHRKRAEEATGRSDSVISQDFRVAEFSDEEINILGICEVTQANIQRLARLEPEAVRKDALAWIATGESADDAIKLALEKVQRDAEKARNPNRKPSEGELSDSEWLVAYCSRVRQQLQDPSTYDRDALCYRRTRTDRQVQKSTARDELAKALRPGYAPFASLAFRHLFVEHPRDWYICHKCNGRNLDQRECECRGAGYKLAFPDHRPDPRK